MPASGLHLNRPEMYNRTPRPRPPRVPGPHGILFPRAVQVRLPSPVEADHATAAPSAGGLHHLAFGARLRSGPFSFGLVSQKQRMPDDQHALPSARACSESGISPAWFDTRSRQASYDGRQWSTTAPRKDKGLKVFLEPGQLLIPTDSDQALEVTASYDRFRPLPLARAQPSRPSMG